jgi:hypothetical protein
LQRIVCFGAEPQMEVASPPFCLRKTARPQAHLRVSLVERNEVTLHALGHIQPFLLAGVGGQTGALARMNRIGVDEEFGPHRLTQWALKAVRQGVVEGQRLQCGFSGGDGPVIRHATGKRRRDRNPTSLSVVFHVIDGRVGQDDARLDRSDQRSTRRMWASV